MDWDEALDLWRSILDRVKYCAVGTVECVLLTPRDCEAVIVVLLELAAQLPPHPGFSTRRSRAHH